MSITVADEGNRRIGEMSSEEVTQCVLDIKSWFERNDEDIQDGATKADFQSLRKATGIELSESFAIFLSIANGGMWYMDKKFLGIEDIIDIYTTLESSKKWNANLLPICGDASEMIVLDCRNDEVFEWDEADGLGDSLSSSFTSFLESYRNALLGGHFEFINGCGVIEKMSGGSTK